MVNDYLHKHKRYSLTNDVSSRSVFDLLGFQEAMLAAMEAGALVIEPLPVANSNATVITYRCPDCNVTGRSESQPHRCWCCGGDGVEFWRPILRDQSMANASWAGGERVDHLVERSA